MIVVGGEALVDLVPTEPGALGALLPRLGGGPYNTAVAAGRLGAPVAFLSRISTDGFGDALRSYGSMILPWFEAQVLRNCCAISAGGRT